MSNHKYFLSIVFTLIFGFNSTAQTKYYITAPRLFDGETMHKDWALIIPKFDTVAHQFCKIGDSASL